MIGRTVSHYRILSPLGSGGMGVVYLAEDSRLGRHVALKFLPASWSQEAQALERFRVEARAASSLSHPAICAIYDIGKDGDTPFIVMEALKGETLRERISKGPLRVAEVVDIGIQLADALEAAHAQGIVHRDIKPANIFVGDRNRVKVLDFGLAKLIADSHPNESDTTSRAARTQQNQITQPGTAIGTVSYMSPEQARGEAVDSRTDLFSLGAVLYEMVTGSQAFGGSTTAVVYDAILNRAPRAIAHLNPLVPLRLETVIATALEKDPDLRYQHASDLEAELRRIRRDIDAGSLVGSQSVPQFERTSTSRAGAPSSSAPSTPLVATTTRKWERASIAVAVLAIIFAGVWIWSTQWRATPVATIAEAPAVAPSTPPAVSPVVEPAPAAANPPPAPSAPASVPSAAPPSRPQVPPAREPSNTRGTPAPPPEPAPGNPPQTTRPATPAPAVQPQPTPTPPVVVPVEDARPSPPPPAAAPTPAPAPPAVETAPAPPPPAPAPPPAATSPARSTPAPEPLPPASPVESDDAAIRRVIRGYEQAIETKNIDLYRSIRPGLTRAAEAVLQNSFRQIDSQEIDVRIESLSIDGRTASARIARRDTIVSAGRRQIQNTTQVLRFQKTDSGWIIAE